MEDYRVYLAGQGIFILRPVKDPEELKRTVFQYGDPINLDLSPGDLILMTQDFLHGSGRNLSGEKRDFYITGISYIDDETSLSVNRDSTPYPDKGGGEEVSLIQPTKGN